MAKQQKGELVVLGFDYSLVGDSADKVRSSAEKILRTEQKTIEDIIEVGTDTRGRQGGRGTRPFRGMAAG